MKADSVTAEDKKGSDSRVDAREEVEIDQRAEAQSRVNYRS